MIESKRVKLRAVCTAVGLAFGLCALPGTPLQAAATTINDVIVSVRANETIARIVFNGTVRFLEQAPIGAASFYAIRFEWIAAEDRGSRPAGQEARAIHADGAVPEFEIVLDNETAGSGTTVRQFTIKLLHPQSVIARQGPNSRTIDIVMRGTPLHPPIAESVPDAGTAQSGRPLSPSSERPFAVALQTLPVAQKDRVKPIPIDFQDFDVFSTETTVDGAAHVEIDIGYFATQAEAEAFRRRAQARFPDARVVDLGQRRKDMLLASSAVERGRQPAAAAASPQPTPPIPVPAPAVAAAPPAPVPTTGVPAVPPIPTVPSAAAEPLRPVSPPASPASGVAAARSSDEIATVPTRPDVSPDQAPQASTAEAAAAAASTESRAAALMAKANQALGDKQFEEAINLLNQVLLLPPNRQSMTAQEAIGTAWDRAGSTKKARAEFELYLKLFPQGDGAQRVAARLAELKGGEVAQGETSKPKEGLAKYFSGNVAQYYYGGKARSTSLVNLPSGIDQSTISKTTESAITTSADLSGRYQTEDSETKVVVRGSNAYNLVATSHNTSSLGSAYVDYKRLGSGLAVRVGRQSPISGGLLGLFDGISLAYPLPSGVKLDLMGGVPANQLVSAQSEKLVAGAIEADGIFEHWGGNAYFVNQNINGITNRRAIGAELRYSAESWSAYSLFDYDAVLRKVNAVSVQGSFQLPGRTTLTLLLDSRKAPSLQLSNALIAKSAASLQALIDAEGMAAVRADALAVTADAKQALISLSRPLGEKWQVAVDMRYSEIGALPAIEGTVFEATPATGGQYTYSAQLTGNNLYSPRDINNFNASVMNTPTFKGFQFAYNNLTGLRDNDLSVEPSFRYYTQKDNVGVKLTRLTPGIRLSYRISRRLSVLGETVVERSTTAGPVNHDRSQSVFFYMGYRYELF
jgi:hypothetical protein